MHRLRPALLFLLVLIPLLSCSRKQEARALERHYQLVGKIIALDSKHHTAMIDAAAIPNFMEAMTMEYPIQSKAEFNTLHVGDSIQATLNVSASGDEFYVNGIRKLNASR